MIPLQNATSDSESLIFSAKNIQRDIVIIKSTMTRYFRAVAYQASRNFGHRSIGKEAQNLHIMCTSSYISDIICASLPIELAFFGIIKKVDLL